MRQSRGEVVTHFSLYLGHTVLTRFIDRQYELQGYRIPLPDSEELCVPEPVRIVSPSPHGLTYRPTTYCCI